MTRRFDNDMLITRDYPLASQPASITLLSDNRRREQNVERTLVRCFGVVVLKSESTLVYIAPKVQILANKNNVNVLITFLSSSSSDKLQMYVCGHQDVCLSL